MFLEMAKGESELDMEGLTQEVDIAAQMILEPSTFSPDRKDSDDESDMSSDGDMEWWSLNFSLRKSILTFLHKFWNFEFRFKYSFIQSIIFSANDSIVIHFNIRILRISEFPLYSL